jgi:hypothetical protein
MFTSISTWILKPYISFQFKKSSIKKLYNYSRVRRNKVKKDQIRERLIEQRKTESFKMAMDDTDRFANELS